MQIKHSVDTALALSLITITATVLSLIRPITIDLAIYASWLADLDSYKFDTGFVFIGQIIRLVSTDVRVLVFVASFLLQLAVLRCCVLIFPDVSRILFVLAGATTYWHVSLSSNVVRNGLAVAMGILILTLGIGSRRLRFALAFIASVLTHWATFLYFLLLSIARPDRKVKLVRLAMIAIAGGSILALGVIYFDLLGRFSVYGSTDNFTPDRSSQIPRLIAQVAFFLTAFRLGIVPKQLKRGSWLALGILIILAPFPEAFSRTSVLTGVLLHIIYFGHLLSERRISYPLKWLVVSIVATIQILHPSTMTLLGITGARPDW